MSRIVVALGGNALGKSVEEQKRKAAHAAKVLVDLISHGHEVVISHGNGPQVGMIDLAFSTAAKENSRVVNMPLTECCAMSQGYIGYHITNAIHNELKKQGLPWQIACVTTQVVVDENDPAFLNPTKPIGSFYNRSDAVRMMENDGNLTMKEDSGRGWRQVVASPMPIDIIEKDSVNCLLDNDFIVVAVGGGGIPVIKDQNGSIHGVSAIVDKDYASAKLAELVNADVLLILTSVDYVSINFGKPDETDLIRLPVSEAEEYINAKQFGEGSMMPKVKAAVMFAKSKKDRISVIASLENAAEALDGGRGTVIFE